MARILGIYFLGGNRMLIHQTYNSTNSIDFEKRFWANTNHPSHFHKHYELIYVESGEIECTVWNRTETVSAGSFCLILSNEVHTIESPKESRIWICIFSTEYVPIFATQSAKHCGSTSSFQCSESIHDFLMENFINKDPDRLLLKACLYAVCSEYLRQVTLSKRTTGTSQVSFQIIDMIENHYHESLTLHDISQATGYNYSYLSLYFNNFFQMPFKDFLNSYRLEKSKQMLLETDKSIAQISFAVGFQSIRNFNHCFKSKLGVSPSEFRRKNKA